MDTYSLSDRGSRAYLTYVVYAKAKLQLRIPLWDELDSISNGLAEPLCVDGDFNDIMDSSEKVGGLQLSRPKISTYHNGA